MVEPRTMMHERQSQLIAMQFIYFTTTILLMAAALSTAQHKTPQIPMGVARAHSLSLSLYALHTQKHMRTVSEYNKISVRATGLPGSLSLSISYT